MKEPNVYTFFDECYVYYGDYEKNIERLKEKVKEWQEISTRINKDNNRLNNIINKAIEYIKENQWELEENGYADDLKIESKPVLEILKGSE